MNGWTMMNIKILTIACSKCLQPSQVFVQFKSSGIIDMNQDVPSSVMPTGPTIVLGHHPAADES